MEFVLNDEDKAFEGDESLSLLKYLRGLGITSLKDGCSQGACGCCTVEIEGRAALACVTPMGKVAGKRVRTLEGLPTERRAVFANAFAEKGGAQCGYCTPGIVMRAEVLLRKNPNPTREEVAAALQPHLCRCTGYKKVIDSILHAAEAIREGRAIEIPERRAAIGERFLKYQIGKAPVGEQIYTADLRLPGMLYGSLRFSDHPRSLIRSIDTSEAAGMPGVVRVFTASDVPGKRFCGLIAADWPLLVAVGEETRYIGDVLAVAVAESEETARRAAASVRVDCEVLPPLTDPLRALLPESPAIHPGGNLLSTTRLRRGDVEIALAQSEFVAWGMYDTQCVEHAFLETECCVVRPWRSGVEVFSHAQGVFEDQKQIASILGLSLDDVRVVLIPAGGAFGGKEDLTVQGHAALCALALGKPVQVRLNRDESIRMHPKRHPFRMEYTLGCDEKGKLTALRARILADTGAYASVGMKVAERAAAHASGAYFVPTVDVESRAVYTNNIPCGAMRGFGVNQVNFALECCVEDLCAQGGFDSWQFRYDNALGCGNTTATGQVIRDDGVRATLRAVERHFREARWAGIACGIKSIGAGNGVPDIGRAKIEIVGADKVVLHHGWTEMGQGIHTIALQTLCQETGIDPKIVELRVDTESHAKCGMTTASRGTSLVGNSILEACRKLRSDLERAGLAELSGRVYEGEWVCDWTTKTGVEAKEVCTHYSYGYATQVVTLGEGGRIERVFAAHDAGRILNPTLFEGQIEGAVHMGLGYALSEKLALENGVPKSTKLRDCGVLRAKETPEIAVIGVESADPNGPYGARGIGEIGLVPTAPAVANAFFRYDGIRRTSLPLLPPGEIESGDREKIC